MASLSGPYRIDRSEPPGSFYTVKQAGGAHSLIPGRDVLAVSGNHRSASRGWTSVGYVCKQTPFGQGIGMGMLSRELRRATPDEVRRALTRDHPHGAHFRPECDELQDASFGLMMSGPTAPQGWTVDRVRPGSEPILPVTRGQIQRAGASALERYRAILADWDNIARRQIEAVLAQLG